MIQKKDFIEIEYTGKTKDDKVTFDTTSKEIAREEGIFQENARYGPIIICVGEAQILPGLENNLVGREEGKEYSIDLPPEDSFGKKNAKLVQLVPTGKFRENKISPVPGMQVNMDGMAGIIKTVSGGRTLVDFNHPLSGKAVQYQIKVLRKVEDDKEKLKGFLQMMDILTDPVVDAEKATIALELPAEMQNHLSAKIKEMIPSLKEVEFTKAKDESALKK